MSFVKLPLIILFVCSLAGCASDGTSSDWSNAAILPNLTNVPTVHYTPDGFDPPYNYY